MAPNDYYPNYYNQNNRSQSHQQPAHPQEQQSSNPQYGNSTYYNYQDRPNNQYATNQQSNQTWANNYNVQDNSHGRAAEALRNLSNNAYNSGSTGASSSGTTTPPRYAGNVQQPQSQMPYNMNSNRTATPPVPADARPRPASTNASAGSTWHALPASVAFPSQSSNATATTVQRSASPYQTHQRNVNSPLGVRARTNISNPAPQPTNYQQASALSHSSTSSAPVNGGYEPPSMQTIDPIQVYDPWPEIQKKQAAARAAKAAEEAARAEAARVAEEERARKAEQDRKVAEAEALRQAEEEKVRLEMDRQIAAEEESKAQEQKKKDEEKKAKEEEKKKKRAEKRKAEAVAGISKSPAVQSVDLGLANSTGGNEEEELRALMAKMRQYHSKNPALLAKVWEEERQANSPQSPQSTIKPPPPLPKPYNGKGKASATAAEEPTHQPTHQPAQQPAPQPARPQAPPAKRSAPANAPAVQPPQRPNPIRVAHVSKTSAGQVWPPEKREALAEAASKWLMQRNAGRTTTIAEICDKLDKNPTYIELCEWFEGMGWKLDRAGFARHLLEAVPDINQPTKTQNETAKQSPPKSNITKPYGNGRVSQPPVNGSVSQPIPFGQTQTYAPPYQPQYTPIGPPQPRYPAPEIDTASPYLKPELPPFPGEPNSHSASPAPLVDTAAPDTKSPSVPAKSKEEAARKRNFSDLIDLTQLSDDDVPPPIKKTNIGGSTYSSNHHFTSNIDPALTIHQEQAEIFARTNAPTNSQTYGPPAQSFLSHQYSGAHAQPTVPLNHPSTQTQQPAPPRDDRSQMDVVKPIDRKKALRRSMYNCKTIARDVLLATGKHPDMRPLNAHLDVLKLKFRFVDNSADLSTFRWDLVDPGEPPKEMLSNNLDGDLADDEDDDEDDEVDKSRDVPRARPVVQQVVQQTVGASGGTATMSAAVTIPSTPVKGMKKRGRPRKDASRTSRPYGFGDGEPRSAPAHSQAAGSSNRESQRLTDSAYPLSSGTDYTPSSTFARPDATSALPPGTTGYAAFRQSTSADGTPLPKKKGRPVGWRKHIHGSAAAQANTSYGSRNPSQPSGLRNVTTPAAPIVVAGVSSPSARKGEPEGDSKDNVFRCRWRNCSAELHNLDTLRKHVFKVHCKQAAHGAFDCMWTGCGQDIKVRDRKTGVESSKRQLLDFATESQWRQHIELQHLASVAWKQGDGPASGLSDAHDSEAYLSDNHGRRVTPRIVAPPERSPSPEVTLAQFQRRPGRPPKKPVEEEAQQTMKNVENRKRSFGPGIDRGGSRLVTEKRRMGFIDDEDVEEVVDMEE